MAIAFINTRPQDRVESMLIQADEYSLPLLALEPCELNQKLKQQLYQINTVDIVVVVSPMAVKVFMDYVQQLSIQLNPKLQWLAVGAKTATQLAKYHIQAQVPESETSEGLLQLSLFSQSIHRVAFLRGYGGREWLMQILHQQGIQIENILLYRRFFPSQTPQLWKNLYPKLKQYHQIFILISSGESWKNWLHLTQYDHLNSLAITYLVLGKRIYQMILDSNHCHPLTKIMLLNKLDRQAIQMAVDTARGSL